MRDVLERCLDASEKIVLSYFTKDVEKEVKSDKSFVTMADKEAEHEIKKIIREHYPDHGILGEEEGVEAGKGYTWIIDPVDGTALFANNIPEYGTLIAVLKGEEIILAGMNFPSLKLRFMAEKGKGATCNGNPIRVTNSEDFSSSIFSVGACIHIKKNSAQANKIYKNLLENIGYIIGTNGPLHDAYVADGRIDGSIILFSRIWDIAAPILFVQEAGGVVTDLDGNDLVFKLDEPEKNYQVVMTTPQLQRKVLELTNLS